jgi:hypothetical protein
MEKETFLIIIKAFVCLLYLEIIIQNSPNITLEKKTPQTHIDPSFKNKHTQKREREVHSLPKL